MHSSSAYFRSLVTRLLVTIVMLCAQTPLLPALVAAVAWAEGSHHVRLGSSGGGVSVILTHSRDQERQATHQHGGLLALVCRTAEDAPHQDHELTFRSCRCIHRAAPQQLPDAPALFLSEPSAWWPLPLPACASASETAASLRDGDVCLHHWLQVRLRTVELVI